jgi:hypothetical protein
VVWVRDLGFWFRFDGDVLPLLRSFSAQSWCWKFAGRNTGSGVGVAPLKKKLVEVIDTVEGTAQEGNPFTRGPLGEQRMKAYLKGFRSSGVSLGDVMFGKGALAGCLGSGAGYTYGLTSS